MLQNLAPTTCNDRASMCGTVTIATPTIVGQAQIVTACRRMLTITIDAGVESFRHAKKYTC